MSIQPKSLGKNRVDESTLEPEERARRILTRFFCKVVFPFRQDKDAKRRSIMREIIETERNYVDGLKCLDVVYYKPLDASIRVDKKDKKKQLIDSQSLSQLFGNIDQVRELHADIILKAMDEIAIELKKPFPPAADYLKVSSTFLDIMPKMKQVYTLYLKTSENYEEILSRLSKDKAFKKFSMKCLFNPLSKCRGMNDLLILPTQRISGYKLVFGRLLNHLPKTGYFTDVHEQFTQLLSEIDGVGAMMNAEKSDVQSQSILLTIAETVSNIPQNVAILKPGRRFLKLFHMRELKYEKETKSYKRGCRFNAYVLNDIIILAEVKEKTFVKKEICRDIFPVIQFRIEYPQADTMPQKLMEKTIYMKSDIHEFKLLFHDKKKVDEFVNFVKGQKKHKKDLVNRQTTEGSSHLEKMLSVIKQSYISPQSLRTREQAIEAICNK